MAIEANINAATHQVGKVEKDCYRGPAKYVIGSNKAGL
jgi:hypothetical protein